MHAFRLVDLSHTIENGLVTYKGLPAPVICDYLSLEHSKKFYAEGTSFQIGKIDMEAIQVPILIVRFTGMNMVMI